VFCFIGWRVALISIDKANQNENFMLQYTLSTKSKLKVFCYNFKNCSQIFIKFGVYIQQ